jgi:phosphoserine aminotransferase
MDKARALVKELTGLGDEYEVLFLQGGASMQFLQVPMNLMKSGGKAAYVNTGEWATRAVKEAGMWGSCEVVASSADTNFNYIPKGYSIPADADYLHITSNNTIFGTQYHQWPSFNGIKVCDMSSDIFSRRTDFAHFDLIYAGAQKNMGPAGATLVIVKKEILGHTGRQIPTMLDYQVHIKGGSMYNTPPVFPIYVSMLTLQWLKDNGGLPWIEEVNRRKQTLFYETLDSLPAFRGTAAKEDRSWMNATFVLTDETYDAEFASMVKEANISQLKGHRSVGGYRASMYNALPPESVQVLCEVMKEFNNRFA